MSRKLLEGNSLCGLVIYYGIGLTVLTYVFSKTSSPFKGKEFQAAVQVLAIPLFIGMAAVAVYLWFSANGAAAMGDRLFGHDPWAQWLVAFTFWYLLLELVLKILCQWRERKDKNAGPSSVYTVQYAHHIATGLLCLDCLHYTFTEYYAIFYLGIAEASSIPLGVMNLFKMSKELVAAYPFTNFIFSLSFCLSFLFVRVVWWLRINYSFWNDAITLLPVGNVALRNGVPVLHIYLWLLANAFLTAMQLYWAQKVTMGLLKHFFPKKAKRSR